MSILFSIFLLAAASAYIARTEKQIRVSALVFAFFGGGAFLSLAIAFMMGYQIVSVSGWLRADLYTWFMVALVSFTYVMSMIVSLRYIEKESREGLLTLDKIRLYFFSIPLFVLAMLIAIFANHLGVLWIGLEGTTLATTILVSLYRKNASIEAAWKFIILCSIGIGLGMIGMLMFVHAGVLSGLDALDAFSYTALREHANLLSIPSVKLAFVFILVGLGTKIGFVPMHTWKPDAYGVASGPVGALLAGGMANVVFFALLKFKILTDLVIGNSSWTDQLMIGFGALSVVVAAFFLLQQRNYKRMLAYSSIEHMGLMGIASGLGPVGMLALTLHGLFHTLIKSTLFFAAGEILLSQKTTKIAGIKNLMKKTPITATLFLFGILAILAVPPSGLFTSEFMIVGSGLQSSRVLTLIILVSLSIIALSMLKSTMAMLYSADDQPVEHAYKERFTLTHTVVIFQLLLIVAFGLLITTAPVLEFFQAITKSI